MMFKIIVNFVPSSIYYSVEMSWTRMIHVHMNGVQSSLLAISTVTRNVLLNFKVIFEESSKSLQIHTCCQVIAD